jgi:putative phosphoribosyl transferase
MGGTAMDNSTGIERGVRIPAENVMLEGELRVPDGAHAVVLFAHGSGSGRHSPRNQFVAKRFNEAGLATLLFDLLTVREEALDARSGHLRFDIPLLARRLGYVGDWLANDDTTSGLKLGLFGASTGAGAALVAAAGRPKQVHAVVSRGGRPDLAGEALRRVKAPTLLIVGGNDEPVIGLNEKALRLLGCTDKQLEILPNAAHLFEEPGALDAVARLALAWFGRHLGRLEDTHSPRANAGRDQNAGV